MPHDTLREREREDDEREWRDALDRVTDEERSELFLDLLFYGTALIEVDGDQAERRDPRTTKFPPRSDRAL